MGLLRHIRLRPPLLLALTLGAAGCTGQLDTGGLDAASLDVPISLPTLDRGGGPRLDRGVGPPDGLAQIDLPTRAEAPCTYGKCGPKLICMANVCKKMCDEPQPGCNLKSPQCKADESCIWASTFTGACIKATAKYLQACGSGAFCVPGTLCVRVGNNPGRCLRLCQRGCPPGVPCSQVSNGCKVCIQ